MSIFKIFQDLNFILHIHKLSGISRTRGNHTYRHESGFDPDQTPDMNFPKGQTRLFKDKLITI